MIDPLPAGRRFFDFEQDSLYFVDAMEVLRFETVDEEGRRVPLRNLVTTSLRGAAKSAKKLEWTPILGELFATTQSPEPGEIPSFVKGFLLGLVVNQARTRNKLKFRITRATMTAEEVEKVVRKREELIAARSAETFEDPMEPSDE